MKIAEAIPNKINTMDIIVGNLLGSLKTRM
jgi:hypothetical protein